jgi:hypothetical protein
MKITPLFLGAVVGLAAMGSAVAAEATPTAAPKAQVVFASPEKYSDIRDGFTSTEMGEKAVLDQIRDYVVKRANEVLPAGQTLTVTFTDIDLAGDFEPWRGAQAMDIRIVKDVYPPRMDLEFKLTGADGAVIKEGKRQLRDLAFLGKINLNREDPLRHEKNLLDDWFKNEFPKAKSG